MLAKSFSKISGLLEHNFMLISSLCSVKQMRVLERTETHDFKELPKISENFQMFLNSSEDFRRFLENF